MNAMTTQTAQQRKTSAPKMAQAISTTIPAVPAWCRENQRMTPTIPGGMSETSRTRNDGDLGDDAEDEAEDHAKDDVEDDLAGFRGDERAQASERMRDAEVFQREKGQGEVVHQHVDGASTSRTIKAAAMKRRIWAMCRPEKRSATPSRARPVSVMEEVEDGRDDEGQEHNQHSRE